MNVGAAILIAVVRLYRIFLSPAKVVLFGPSARCRFTPSCSDYAIDALRLHGVLRGGWFAALRLCRCHPWGGCGCDPVPAPGHSSEASPVVRAGAAGNRLLSPS